LGTAVVGRAEPACVTVDRHVVGRVGKHHGGAFVTDQDGTGCGIENVAAQDAVAIEEP
jgi:hypothetical protein